MHLVTVFFCLCAHQREARNTIYLYISLYTLLYCQAVVDAQEHMTSY